MTGLFVWAGSRWCEVDAASGRVRGWRRRARFVFRAGGRLQVASTAAVLRGLRSLLAGKPTTVLDGAPLSQRRSKRQLRMHKGPCKACTHNHSCCAGNNGAANQTKNSSGNIQIEELVAPVTADTGVQVTLSSQTLAKSLPEPRRPPKPRPKRKRSSSSESQVVHRKVFADVHRNSSGNESPQKRRSQVTQSEPLPKPSSQSQEMLCKELVINEDDVDLYRSYLIKHDPEFDAYRFDTDEDYKMNVFFRINPLVNMERCVRVERMLRNSQSSQEMSLKDFATKLGLRSISDHESETATRYKMRNRVDKSKVECVSDSETDKENQVQLRPRRDDSLKHSQLGRKIREEQIEKKKRNMEVRTRNSPLLSLRSNVGLAEPGRRSDDAQSSSKIDKEKEVPKTTVRRENVVVSDSGSDFVLSSHPPAVKPVKKIPIKYAIPSGQKRRRQLVPYSNLEDHALVSWVSAGGRARLVNGNRVWRELQDQYFNLTGQRRSWHSLRNRYLRHVLPALGSLALPPAQAASLRAAAAAGELKKKGIPRRNSMFAPPPRSASARRPRPPRPDSLSEASDPPAPRASASAPVRDAVTKFLRGHQKTALAKSTEAAAKSTASPASPAKATDDAAMSKDDRAKPIDSSRDARGRFLRGHNKSSDGQRDASNAKSNDSRAKSNDSRAKLNDSRANSNDSRAKSNDSRAKLNDSRAKPNDSRVKPNDSRAKPNDSRAKSNESRAKLNSELELVAKALVKSLRGLNHSSGSSTKSDHAKSSNRRVSPSTTSDSDVKVIAPAESNASPAKTRTRTSRAKSSPAKLNNARPKRTRTSLRVSDSEDDFVNGKISTESSIIESRTSRAKLRDSDVKSDDPFDSSELDEPRDTRTRRRRLAKLPDTSEDSSDQSEDRDDPRDGSRKLGKSRDSSSSDTTEDSLVLSHSRRPNLRDRSKLDASDKRDTSGRLDRLRDRRNDKSKKRENSADSWDSSVSRERSVTLIVSDSADEARDETIHRSSRRGNLRDKSASKNNNSRGIETRNRSKAKDGPRDKSVGGRREQMSSDDDFQAKRISRTPTYDQLTRQFGVRLRSTPIDRDKSHATKSQATKSHATKSQRTRKLYNPNAPGALLR